MKQNLRLVCALLVAFGAIPANSGHASSSQEGGAAASSSQAAQDAYRMGRAYHRGEGVPADRDAALIWLRRASEAGSGEATEELGLMLSEQPEHFAEAIALLDRAARQGQPIATYLMGLAYGDGDHVVRNPPLSFAYLLRAEAMGVVAASEPLSRQRGLLTPEDIAQGERLAALLARASDSRETAQSSPVAVSQISSGPASAGRWRVQLGAYSTEQAARRAWAQFSAYPGPGTLSEPSFEPIGKLVRLRMSVEGNRSSADAMCDRARGAGLACLVLAN